MKSYDYCERFTAFLDILGFTELICRTATVPPEVSIDMIITAIDVPRPAEEGQMLIGNVGDISKSDHKIAQFSDSIIISTEDTAAGLLHLVNHVERIAFNFLKLGFLCRGGISKGLLYHEKNNAFGPAMVEAYHLESKKAQYPRIILSREVERFIDSMDGGESIVIKRMVIRYQDCSIVHVLRPLIFRLDMTGAGGEPELLFLKIKSHLTNEISRLKDDQKKLEKVLWFQEYFNERVYVDPMKVVQAVLRQKKGAA
jgi:hypothetical protein